MRVGGRYFGRSILFIGRVFLKIEIRTMRQKRRGGTAGQRHRSVLKIGMEGGMRQVCRSEVQGRRGQGGRNHRGRVTVRHRGGGVKRSRRKRVNGGAVGGYGRVRGIQYDPNRSGRIARRKVLRGETLGPERGSFPQRYRYVLAVEGRKVGDCIRYGSGRNAERISAATVGSGIGAGIQLRGSHHQRKDRVGGRKVCNVSVIPGEGGKYRRSAGRSGQLRQKRQGRVQIRRKGGKRREVSEECTATVGMVSGEEHRKVCRGKAGTRRRRGWRPTVRGEAMNPVDHPHGGRTRGGRPEVTPWSRRAKGKPTRKEGKALGKGWAVTTGIKLV
jgi:large subunit ribosomal protein L2